MGEVLHLPPRIRLISAREATFASIERNTLRVAQGDDLARICLEAVSRYPDAKISQTARICLEELAGRVDPPSECEPGDVA